jgi:hypothetical protein
MKGARAQLTGRRKECVRAKRAKGKRASSKRRGRQERQEFTLC